VKLKTIDIPQADTLSVVRLLLDGINRSPKERVKDLAATTGFSERHIRYRLHAARILGFLSDDDGRLSFTSRGRELVATVPGSAREKEVLRQAVSDSPIVQRLAPDLLGGSQLDWKEVAKKISSLSGVAPTTAERRAGVLRSWQRALT